MKIKLGRDFNRDQVQIVFMDYEGMVKRAYNFYTGETKVIEEGVAVDDDYILKIPSHLMPELLKAMADLLEEEKIQTDSQHKIEGKLDATKYHLEDLRKILKLKK